MIFPRMMCPRMCRPFIGDFTYISRKNNGKSAWWGLGTATKYTDKKENQIFLICKEIQSGAVAKSYMRKGYLIYEEMRKYFFIYEEGVSHIWVNMTLQRLPQKATKRHWEWYIQGRFTNPMHYLYKKRVTSGQKHQANFFILIMNIVVTRKVCLPVLVVKEGSFFEHGYQQSWCHHVFGPLEELPSSPSGSQWSCPKDNDDIYNRL